MAASAKEERIRKITLLYYSRPEVQKAILDFSAGREVCPRYFEGFGKRPDSLQYLSDAFELAKKGATSFHCSEELWSNPLEVQTGMKEQQLNELRTGWDLLLDIDSKYLDYSRIYAEIIISFLEFSGIKNIGIKFSGSKGFHIIVPWKAFPKEVNGVKTSSMFPEWPRIITKYVMEKTKSKLIEEITKLSAPNKYIRDFQAPKEVIPDLVLIAPRHLFRAPYSLHEKTALASAVISKAELADFHPRSADPFKINFRNFAPDCREGEATELLMQALDWCRDNSFDEKKQSLPERQFAPVSVDLSMADRLFPPSIKKILEGIKDGKKRALFILINFFRSLGTEKQELEKQIDGWNKKNPEPLHESYIKAQLAWSYRNKVSPPPNYDKDYYKGIGVIPTQEEMKFKNPVNYVLRKNSSDLPKKKKGKDNFKNSK
jgi:hypothetical protein